MNQETMKKMREMKLFGMHRAFQASMEAGLLQITADELVAHLIDTEFNERYNRKLSRLVKQAKFRYKASFPEIDFEHPRELDKNKLLRLSDCSWF
jgi:DNA replication protein DnaC